MATDAAVVRVGTRGVDSVRVSSWKMERVRVTHSADPGVDTKTAVQSCCCVVTLDVVCAMSVGGAGCCVL